MVACGVSGIFHDERCCGEAYEEATNFILEYAGREQGEHFADTIRRAKMVCDLEDKVRFSIVASNREQVQVRLKELWDFYLKYLPEQEAYEHFFRSILMLLNNLNRQLGVRIKTSDVEKITEDRDIGSADVLIGKIMEVLGSIDDGRQSIMNPRLVRKAKEYIAENYQFPIDLSTVAETLGVSRGYLSKCFSNSENMGFSEYLTFVRLEQAKKMLKESELTVQDIAYEVGFSDPNYFGKSFKKNTGLSPREYQLMQDL